MICSMQGVFKRLFDPTAAQVALINLEGVILETNRAWKQFGQDNGLPPDYQCVGKNYLHVCEAAVAANEPGSQRAYLGLLSVIRVHRPKFTMVYTCHSPNQRRWFRMWVEPQLPEVPAIVIAHYVQKAVSIDSDNEQSASLIPPMPDSYTEVARDFRAQVFQQLRKF
jgi:hypothetical protein